MKTLCTNAGDSTPNMLRADPQSLPMPDMCIIETLPFNEIIHESRSPTGQQLQQHQQQHQQPEDDQREMQTSFITFKPGSTASTTSASQPNTSTTSSQSNQDSCKTCCSRVSAPTKGPSSRSPTAIYDTRRREVQTCSSPYGTLGEARSKTIYDTTPQKNCVECVRDRESIYSTRKRELLNANNLSHSANNSSGEGHINGGNDSPNQTV